MSLKTEVARNNIIITGGNIAAALLSFIFNVVLARLLPPEQFGLFSFTMVVMAFFLVFADPGTGNTFIKFISECLEKKEESKVRSLVGIFLKVKVFLYSAVAAIMIIFSGQISHVIFNKPESGAFVTLAAVLLVSNLAIDFANGVFTGLKKFSIIVGLRLLERMLRITLVVALVLAGLSVFGAIAGVIAGFLLTSALITAVLMRSMRALSAKGSGFQKKLLFSFGFWSLLGTMVYGIYAIADPLMVSILRPVQDVGFYSIATLWMTLITYLVPISAVVMYPYFSGSDKAKGLEAFKKSLKYTMLSAMPLAFIMSAFSVPIIRIFYKPEFTPAAGALNFLSLSSIPLVLGLLLMSYIYGLGRPKMHTLVITCVFALSIALNFIFIGYYGIRGAGLASLICRCVEVGMFLAVIALMRRGLNWDSVIKPLIGSLVIYIIASWLPVLSIVHLILYGIFLLVLYLGIMLSINGIDRCDMSIVFSWLSSVFRRKA